MSLDIQGFIQIGALINNEPGQTAAVGELSEQSHSFARSKQYFSKSNLQVEFVAFTSKRDKTTITVPSAFSDHILTLSQWIYTQSINGNFKNDEVEFQRLLLGQFNTTIGDVQSGSMIASDSNWFPRWVSWKLIVAASGVEDPTDVDNTMIVWFDDADFNLNYTGCEIYPQMPIMPVDVFMGVKSAVAKAMEAFNLPDHHEAINVRAAGYPYTALATHNYTWHDREDYDATLLVPISLLIYGRAGLNPTRQKEALRDYILENSDYPVSDWVKVFPEIFTTTKFTFVPGWSVRGIPNEEDIAALYSPMLPYDFLVKAVKQFGEWGAQTVAQKNSNEIPKPTTDVQFFPSIYKSLSGIVISGPENAIDKDTLNKVIPDYALISTQNADIARVSKATTDWLKLFFEALVAAEEYHPYDTSLSVVKGVDAENPALYYYVFEYDNVEYRVIARKAVWGTEEADTDATS